MNRVELFESLGFEHTKTYQTGNYETVYNFKKSIPSEYYGWLEWLACTSYPNETRWYIFGERTDGPLGKTDTTTFEMVFDGLTGEQQEIAVWHLDILR